MPGPPVAERADPEQNGQRDDEQDDGDGGRTGRIVGLDLARDVDRGDLGLEGDIAGDQYDRTEFADGPGEGQRDAGKDRWQQVRKDDWPADRERAGAQRLRRLLHVTVEL